MLIEFFGFIYDREQTCQKSNYKRFLDQNSKKSCFCEVDDPEDDDEIKFLVAKAMKPAYFDHVRTMAKGDYFNHRAFQVLSEATAYGW